MVEQNPGRTDKLVLPSNGEHNQSERHLRSRNNSGAKKSGGSLSLKDIKEIPDKRERLQAGWKKLRELWDKEKRLKQRIPMARLAGVRELEQYLLIQEGIYSSSSPRPSSNSTSNRTPDNTAGVRIGNDQISGTKMHTPNSSRQPQENLPDLHEPERLQPHGPNSQKYPNLPPKLQVEQTGLPIESDPHPPEYYVGNRGNTPPLPEQLRTKPTPGDIHSPGYHTGGPGPYIPPQFRPGGR